MIYRSRSASGCLSGEYRDRAARTSIVRPGESDHGDNAVCSASVPSVVFFSKSQVSPEKRSMRDGRGGPQGWATEVSPKQDSRGVAGVFCGPLGASESCLSHLTKTSAVEPTRCPTRAPGDRDRHPEISSIRSPDDDGSTGTPRSASFWVPQSTSPPQSTLGRGKKRKGMSKLFTGC